MPLGPLSGGQLFTRSDQADPFNPIPKTYDLEFKMEDGSKFDLLSLDVMTNRFGVSGYLTLSTDVNMQLSFEPSSPVMTSPTNPLFSTYWDSAFKSTLSFDGRGMFSNLEWVRVWSNTRPTDALQIDNFSFVRVEQNPVPEPATMILFGTGIAGLIAARRRKKAC